MKMIGVTILLLVAITTISARPSAKRERINKYIQNAVREREESIRNEPESNDNEYATGQQIPVPFPYPPYLRAWQQMAESLSMPPHRHHPFKMAELEQEEEEEEEAMEEEEEGMEEKNAKRKRVCKINNMPFIIVCTIL